MLGGYSEEFFKNNPEKCNLPATIYYLKVGSAYKLGITTNLYNRLRSIKSESKKEVEVLDTFNTTLLNAFKLEQYLFDLYKDHRTYRNWSTEIFSKNVLEKSLQEYSC